MSAPTTTTGKQTPVVPPAPASKFWCSACTKKKTSSGGASCEVCGKPSDFRCPKCNELKMPPAHFCGPTCFNKAWREHNKAKHSEAAIKLHASRTIVGVNIRALYPAQALANWPDKESTEAAAERIRTKLEEVKHLCATVGDKLSMSPEDAAIFEEYRVAAHDYAARSFKSMNLLKESLTYGLEALEFAKKVFSPDNKELVVTQLLVAEILFPLKRYEETAAQLEAALENFKAYVRATKRDVEKKKDDGDDKKEDDDEKKKEEAAERKEKDDDVEPCGCQMELLALLTSLYGRALVGKGGAKDGDPKSKKDLQAAGIAKLREAVSIFNNIYPVGVDLGDHPLLAHCLTALGLELEVVGEMEEAEKVQKQAAMIKQRMLGVPMSG